MNWSLFTILVLLVVLGIQQIRYRQAIKQSQRFGYILDHVEAFIYVKDRHRRYTYANKPTLTLFDITKCQLAGFKDQDFFSPETAKRIETLDLKILNRSPLTHEEVVSKENGNTTVYLDTKHPLLNRKGDVEGILGISTTVTETWNLRKTLEHQAHIDPLTQLCNRQQLDKVFALELQRCQRYQHPLSIIIADIDHFKEVNDNHGHQVGDAVLKQFARLLESHCRVNDCLGRWGGEEFLLICPQTHLQQASQLAERIRHQVELFSFHGIGRRTLSLGVSEFKANDTPTSLTERADEALYRAKQQGRNQVCTETSALTPL
ncbi:sensor domain-containing diguanylate cyclase [Ferrimonas kyonanensis]|uniref:sensor domain-containing diguanylate cyclase n=1 Tax=Ferrimonas kyonanensis TaxID=364763 RepID=UPI0003F93FD1|nr:GGDEF domain-containing protein [Ferrimonas kyonanensis]